MQHEKERHVASIALKKAKECLEKNNNGLAFANFLLVLKLAPHLKCTIESEFLECMHQWCETLHNTHRSEDLLQCLHEACSVLPDNPLVLNTMGTELFRLGFLDEAASFFRKSLQADPSFLLAWSNLQNLCSHVVERWHFRMLNDRTRNKAFQTAISRAVKNGYVHVLDVGSGSGLLSMFAASAGALSVHGCEMSKVMYDISTECVTFNHLADKITLIHKKSTQLIYPHDIPERISLLVTETFDAGLLGEHIISTMAHAWQHLLINTSSKKSVVIPAAATVYICAIESDWLRTKHRVIYPGVRYLEYGKCHFTSQVGLSIDDCDMEPYTCCRLCDIPGGIRYLSDVKTVEKFFFNDPKAISDYDSGFIHNHTLTLTSQGRLDALVLWFDLHLDETTSLSSHPSADSCWEQAVYPVLPEYFDDFCESLHVSQNDQLVIHSQCCNNALHIKPVKIFTHCSKMQEEAMTLSQCQELNPSSKFDRLNDFHFILNTEEISSLNDLTWNQVHCQALEEVRAELKETASFKVLFIMTGVSLLPLQALRLDAGEVCIVSKNPVIKEVLTAIATQNDLSTDRLEYVGSVDDVPGKWSVLVADVVESCGSLQSQILEDIAFTRMTCMLPNSVVIPDCVNVFGVLVESGNLLHDSCVESKKNTLNFEIGKFINDFQMMQHVDIHLSTLKHQKLSIPFKMFTFNFNEPLDENSELNMTFLHQDNLLSITATETGVLAGILYWFDLTLSSSMHFSTLDGSSHLKQAAILQKKPSTINAETEINLRALCKNSCFDITLF